MVLTGKHWVAIACAKNAAFALECEGQHGTGIRYDTPFLILYFDGNDRYVAAIGSNLQTVSF